MSSIWSWQTWQCWGVWEIAAFPSSKAGTFGNNDLFLPLSLYRRGYLFSNVFFQFFDNMVIVFRWIHLSSSVIYRFHWFLFRFDRMCSSSSSYWRWLLVSSSNSCICHIYSPYKMLTSGLLTILLSILIQHVRKWKQPSSHCFHD